MCFREQAFTLLELLLALFVFSLLSAFSFRAVGFLSDSANRAGAEVGQLKDAQQVISVLEADFRSAFGVVGSESVDEGEVGFQLVFGGLSLDATGLEKGTGVEYQFSEKKLLRKKSYFSSDIGEAPLFLLSEVEEFNVELPFDAKSATEAKLSFDMAGLGGVVRVFYRDINVVQDPPADPFLESAQESGLSGTSNSNDPLRGEEAW